MNVFVLTTGRSGSQTVARAFGECSNFHVGHESSRMRPIANRFDYRDRHIEVDCRLVWFLPLMDYRYPEAFWIHLKREREPTVRSLEKRAIIDAYRLVLNGGKETGGIADHYYDTVNETIERFLFPKRILCRTANIMLGDPESFRYAWDAIGCRGDLNQALRVFATVHNARNKMKALENA